MKRPLWSASGDSSRRILVDIYNVVEPCWMSLLACVVQRVPSLEREKFCFHVAEMVVLLHHVFPRILIDGALDVVYKQERYAAVVESSDG